ncbi:hypothetical protein [Roseateles toxinivorans]|uniref:Uncharacterized protein n=1 Tax=Roseateles toxinivorans TaxID=270368 RepID=A0A4R6QLG3_9BURK|nr:hypothetical protein [Roseateles toxinivorans]TDP71113.1 hypothetical protein DES47_10391 [Roseateles toxinivorans]
MCPAPTHIPRLRYRPTTRHDLDECLGPLLPPWLGLDEALSSAFRGLWWRLLGEPGITSTVMEDLALPPGQRIQGWGCGIALSSARARELELDTAPRAFMARQIYARLQRVDWAPMTDRELGQANARGEFCFFNMHYSQRHNDLDDPYVHSVINIANEAFRAAAGGYNTQAMYFETSVQGGPVMLAAGFRARPFADASSLAGLPPERCPMLFAMSRSDARASLPGTSVRHVFEHHPPLFHFSATQRRLLWLALFDDSDEHLMPLLEVSVHGLKKLWRGIYERIEDRMPGFFGDAAAEDEGKRGPEKRRQVLAYVRQRPEELRPWASS